VQVHRMCSTPHLIDVASLKGIRKIKWLVQLILDTSLTPNSTFKFLQLSANTRNSYFYKFLHNNNIVVAINFCDLQNAYIHIPKIV